MKKLIMCVAAVLSACTLNAATVDWGVSDLWGNEEIVGSITLAAGAYSSEAVIDGALGIASGSFTGFDWGTDPFSSGASWTATAKVKSLADGQMYEKVFNLTLGTLDPNDYDRSGPTAFASMIDGLKLDIMPDGWLDESDLGGAGWAASSGGGGVPEPTSGLLLALGGAMLALRRRR